MSDISIPSVIIGIAGALVGVYYRESIRKAYRQKQLAVRIEAEVSIAIQQLVLFSDGEFYNRAKAMANSLKATLDKQSVNDFGITEFLADYVFAEAVKKYYEQHKAALMQPFPS